MNRSKSGAAFATAFMAGAMLCSHSANASSYSVTESFAPNTIIYTLTNIPLSDGGVLNGTFATDNYGPGESGLVTQGLYAFDLTTSGGSQPGITYTPAVNAIAIGAYYQPTGWDFYNGYSNELQLLFAGNLITGIGVSLLGGVPGPSFECFDSFSCPSGSASDFALRYVGVTATPLPSTWTMLIAGFVGLGFFAYRGSKKNAAALAAA